MSDDPMVAVLREHEWDAPSYDGYHVEGCDCGWRVPLNGQQSWEVDRPAAYRAHLADVLRAAGYIHRDEQEMNA